MAAPRHQSYRVVLHGAPLSGKPDGNVVVLFQCDLRREALRWIIEEADNLRGQGNWAVTGSAQSGYTVVATDRTDLWFSMHIKAERRIGSQ